MEAIVTLTMNPAIDKNSSVDTVVPERKLRCSSPTYEPGGGGMNVTRAISRLGGDSVAVYPAGGPTGEMLEGLMQEEGLAHRAIPVRALTRENLVVFEQSTGQQFRFGMPGTSLEHAEWQQCLDTVSNIQPRPGYLVASGSLPPGVPTDLYRQIGQVGSALGTRVIIDASGDALHQALQEGVYLIKPNIREFGELVGREFTDEHDLETEAASILNSGRAEVVAISLGPGGLLAVWRGGRQRIQSPVVPIQSKVGAGDSTVAGIALSLARGWPLVEALRFGVAAGAAAVMTPGTELCRLEDTERLYRQMQTAQPGAGGDDSGGR